MYLYIRFRHTHPIPVQCWASVAAVDGSMPVNCLRRWPDTTPSLAQRVTLLHQRLQQPLDGSPMLLHVDPTCLTMAKQQTNILYAYFAAKHCRNCYAGDTFFPCRQKSHYPDNTIHWPSADVMLAHHLRRCANIIPSKTLKALITNIIMKF